MLFRSVKECFLNQENSGKNLKLTSGKILLKVYVDTVCLYKIYDQIEEKVTGKKNEDLRFNFAPEKKLD